MEVKAQSLAGGFGATGLDQPAHRPGIRHADGVGQGDLVEGQPGRLADQVDHPGGGNFALEGAAEGDGKGRRQAGTALSGPALGDGGKGGHLLGGPSALVAHTEGVGSADHHIGLVAPGGDGAVPAAHVQHQADPGAQRIGGKGGADLLGAGPLGDARGIDEGDGLDPAGAGGLQPSDELDPLVRAEDGLFILKAVAGSDLDDLDEAAHGRTSVWGRGGGA